MTRPTDISKRHRPIWLNQLELASAFDISRSTVTQFQKEGMPYEQGRHEHRYRLGTCGYWIKGRNFLKRRNKELPTPEMTVLVGRVLDLSAPVAPETPTAFARNTRAFMRSHFKLTGDEYERTCSEAFRLVASS